MRHVFLALSLLALLFNAAVAEAAPHTCAAPKAAPEIAQTAAKAPCHTTGTALTHNTPSHNNCCGEVCLCIAKAPLKTLDVLAIGIASPKRVTLTANSVMATKSAFNLSTENPPPQPAI